MRRFALILMSLIVAAVVALAALMAAYRFVPPVSTLMLARWATGEPVTRDYVPLAQISRNLQAAVVASEDAKFCRHDGVDWDALMEVMEEADEDGPSRGASTIPMQTVKNLFLWPWRTAARKAFEIALALALDFVWPKRRILEAYLNVAEWGDGLFGAEAAARRYFGRAASELDARQAALLAVSLPNPRRRDPARPSRFMSSRAATIQARMREADLSCVK
ncbi:monofunctional biosynthetic peptidoglycan transglycosylase [Methylocella sp.]|uniref:monofunctional biosynthetic peptidoglycan transglycosylase n=1 Tax=Methylocella sp. TaxID=1978226 RepID=UPI0037841B73